MTKPFTERPDKSTGFQRLFPRARQTPSYISPPPPPPPPFAIRLGLGRDRKNGIAACRECPFPRDNRATREWTLGLRTPSHLHPLDSLDLPPSFLSSISSTLFHSCIASLGNLVAPCRRGNVFHRDTVSHASSRVCRERGRERGRETRRETPRWVRRVTSDSSHAWTDADGRRTDEWIENARAHGFASYAREILLPYRTRSV